MTNRKMEDPGGGLRDTLITIVGVMVYILYRAVKGIAGFIMKFLGAVGRFRKSDIGSVVGAILLIVLAIVFWPVTIAASGAIFMLAILFMGAYNSTP